MPNRAAVITGHQLWYDGGPVDRDFCPAQVAQSHRPHHRHSHRSEQQPPVHHRHGTQSKPLLGEAFKVPAPLSDYIGATSAYRGHVTRRSTMWLQRTVLRRLFLSIYGLDIY